jgi:two-component system, chemotaxis family, protein-glutamate methylesterase/glutaminase
MNLVLSTARRTRVLIADDSFFMRELLSEIVQSAPSLELCATAQHGIEALEKIHQSKPDVVILDVEMPLLNGIEVLKRIMEDSPRPVIMVSSHTQQGADTTLEALSLGAFDYLPKPGAGNSPDPRKFGDELISKIEAAAQSAVYKTGRGIECLTPAMGRIDDRPRPAPEIIAIGTSTGGPRALQEILPELPRDLPVPMIVVQHMPVGFTGPLAKRLNLISDIKVKEAEHGQTIEPGIVYVAPAGRQTTVKGSTSHEAVIVLSDHFLGALHKPSVDLMMLSVAALFGPRSCGIILTGMGCDGLQGMSAIHRAGGLTIGQDETTCTVYGMPRACAEKGILQKVLPLGEIPKEMLRALKYSSSSQKEQSDLVRGELHGIVR